MSNTFPLDRWQRVPRYLRLSVTDRCNFSCVYCGDAARRQYIPHERVLRYEDMARFAAIAARLGIGKIRVTGGEPFARRNCMEFLASLRAAFPGMILSLTTNGSLLEPHIRELSRLGLASVNVSLDSFDADTFTRLTGKNALRTVLANIDRLLAAGQRIKLNAVAIRGVTDAQIGDFVHAAKNMPLDIRFIEFMPLGKGTLWDDKLVLPAGELMRLAGQKAILAPAYPEACREYAGPARMYDLRGGKGRLGFISPLTDHFCAACNRMRLTSDGKVKLCLFGDKEYNFAAMLKDAPDEAVARALANAWQRKPMGCEILGKLEGGAATRRQMAAIGG